MLRPSNFLVIDHPAHGVTKVEIKRVHESGKIQVFLPETAKDDVFDIEPNWILMRFSRVVKPWTLKSLLQAFWGHLGE